MPHSIDIGDLVQDGVIGLIDAANRFDEARGIKFETFAERRIRGAMIDALAQGCVAAWRPSSAPGARGRARGAQTRIGARTVAGRSRRQGRIGRKASRTHDRENQRDRVDLAAGEQRKPRRITAAHGFDSLGAGAAGYRLRTAGNQGPRERRDCDRCPRASRR